MKFPNDTKIRTLQFDSFFIQCVKKVQDTKRMELLPNEAYWLYRSESYLHDFVAKATLDTKIAILAKLGFHYAITVYDDVEGCNIIKWNEQIRAAQGLETSKAWFDEFTQYSHTFILGSYEVRKILNRLEVMYHSKMFRISRYITRLRDLKRLKSYESLKKEDDFISFMLKVALGYARIAAADEKVGLTERELGILIYLYIEHTFLEHDQINEAVKEISSKYSTRKSLDILVQKKLVEKSKHPYNFGKQVKRYSYLCSESGLDLVRTVCSKILNTI